jgi:hypothetical protein
MSPPTRRTPLPDGNRALTTTPAKASREHRNPQVVASDDVEEQLALDEIIDLSHDRHGEAIDYAQSLDRRWFARHPNAKCYERPPVPHEMCDPFSAARGKCVPIFDLPDGSYHIIEVVQVVPGVRFRRAWHVRDVEAAS